MIKPNAGGLLLLYSLKPATHSGLLSQAEILIQVENKEKIGKNILMYTYAYYRVRYG